MAGKRKPKEEQEGKGSNEIKLEPYLVSGKRGKGRPTEGLDSLPSNWRQDIIDMYAMGSSDVEVKATIYMWRGSFSNDLWDRWLKEEKDFSETILIGRMIAEAWYTKLGREQLKNGYFPFSGWFMQMKNRFGWKDKTETNGTFKNENTNLNYNSEPMSPERIRAISDALEKEF